MLLLSSGKITPGASRLRRLCACAVVRLTGSSLAPGRVDLCGMLTARALAVSRKAQPRAVS